jgi:hypothetical protein
MGFSFHRSIPVVDLEVPLARVRAKVIGAAQVRILAAVEAGKRGQNEMPDAKEGAGDGVHGATSAKEFVLCFLSSAGVPLARVAGHSFVDSVRNTRNLLAFFACHGHQGPS